MLQNQTVAKRNGDNVILEGFSKFQISTITGEVFDADGLAIAHSKSGKYTLTPDADGEHLKFTKEEAIEFCSAYIADQDRIAADLAAKLKNEEIRSQHNKLKQAAKAASTRLTNKSLSLDPNEGDDENFKAIAPFSKDLREATAALKQFVAEHAEFFAEPEKVKSEDARKMRQEKAESIMTPEQRAKLADLEKQLADKKTECSEAEIELQFAKENMKVASNLLATAKEKMAPFVGVLKDLQKEINSIKGEKTRLNILKASVTGDTATVGLLREGTQKMLLYKAVRTAVEQHDLDLRTLKISDIADDVFETCGLRETNRGRMTIGEALRDMRAELLEKINGTAKSADVEGQSDANAKIQARLEDEAAL